MNGIEINSADISVVDSSIRASNLLPEEGTVVVMLSGGRDSVCLLDATVRAIGAQRVLAFHVNYGLRPQAEEDTRFCETLCLRLGVELKIARPGRLHESGENLQAWARNYRYEQATRLASELRDKLAVGHTASDQIETVLYRLASSPGRRALLGMPASHGRLIRPLLSVTRDQTAAYCRARGLEWRDDVSNSDVRFKRNLIRERLVPAFREVHTAAESNLLATVESLQEESAALEAIVERRIDGRSRIPGAELATMPFAIARLVIRQMAESVTGGYVPQAALRARELIDAAVSGSKTQIDVGGGARASVVSGQLEFKISSGPAAPRCGPAGHPVDSSRIA